MPAASAPTAAPAPTPAPSAEAEHDRWGIKCWAVIAGITIAVAGRVRRVGVAAVAGRCRSNGIAVCVHALGVADVVELLQTTVGGSGIVCADRTADREAGGGADRG